MSKIMKELESNISLIQNSRRTVADLKKDKIETRAKAWIDATGTAKEKEDFVRSVVADYDRQIAYEESNIEYLYNKNKKQ